jgi:hypothetical protein
MHCTISVETTVPDLDQVLLEKALLLESINVRFVGHCVIDNTVHELLRRRIVHSYQRYHLLITRTAQLFGPNAPVKGNLMQLAEGAERETERNALAPHTHGQKREYRTTSTSN